VARQQRKTGAPTDVSAAPPNATSIVIGKLVASQRQQWHYPAAFPVLSTRLFLKTRSLLMDQVLTVIDNTTRTVGLGVGLVLLLIGCSSDAIVPTADSGDQNLSGTDSRATEDGDAVGDTGAEQVVIDDSSFGCIQDMTPVRGFFVDNLLGDLAATVAVANEEAALPYPAGTVIQLVPLEAMVKREAGFSALTNDWEFFSLGVDQAGTRILERGATEVENQFGGNCFDCHAAAWDFDLVCETGHGCEPLQITDDMIDFFVDTDARCE